MTEVHARRWYRDLLALIYILLGKITAILFGGVGWVSVKQFGAVGDGVADDTAAIQRAINAVAGTGVSLWFPAGRYLVTSQILLRPFLTIWGSAGTTIHQVLTTAGNFAAFSGTPILGPVSAITATNALGSNVVQSDANRVAGTWVWLVDNVGFGLRGNLYKVLSSAPSGPNWNLALDRPVLWQFAPGDHAYPVTTMMQEVRIFGNGMRFTGTSAGTVKGYVGFGTAYRCYIYDCVADDSLGAIGADSVAFNFDIGSLECIGARCKVVGGGVMLDAFALQSCERSYFIDCTAENMTGWTHPMFDCRDCGMNDCSGSGSASGVVFTSNEAAAPGCVDCSAMGGSYNGNAAGVLVQYGSQNATIGGGLTISDSTQNGIVVDGIVAGIFGLTIDNVSVKRTAGGTGALYIAGTGNLVDVSNFRTESSQSMGINVTGATTLLTIDGYTSIDDGLAGGFGNFALRIQAQSDVIVKRSRFINRTTIPGFPFMIYPQAGCKLSLDDVTGQVVAPSATTPVMIGLQEVVDVRLRNVRTIGAVLEGVVANAGVASVVRILEGCDFSSCSVPISLDATCQPNRVSVTSAGTGAPQATAFAKLTASEQVKATMSALAGTPAPGLPLIIPTAGVGWTSTFAATDTSTYKEEAA